MTTGVAIPGGSGPLSIRNLLCGGDVHGNALGRWSMLALPAAGVLPGDLPIAHGDRSFPAADVGSAHG